MQGVLYFSMQDSFQKDIMLMESFCKNESNQGLLVSVKNDIEGEFIEEFFHRQDAFIISDIEIQENMILGDTEDYVYSIIDNYDGKIIVLKNPEKLLNLQHKNIFAGFLKQLIDEAQSRGYKIAIICKNDSFFNILPDLSSRIRSFNRIFLNG